MISFGTMDGRGTVEINYLPIGNLKVNLKRILCENVNAIFMAKFRTGVASLRLETGRYENLKVNQRKCLPRFYRVRATCTAKLTSLCRFLI